MHCNGSVVKWLTVFSYCWILVFMSIRAVTLVVVEEQEKHKRSVTQRSLGWERKTHLEDRALERCTGVAHYFPGDRWQKL